MDRVGQILRALFRRALSEHGRDAPALIDIVIERAHGRLEPRIGVGCVLLASAGSMRQRSPIPHGRINRRKSA